MLNLVCERMNFVSCELLLDQEGLYFLTSSCGEEWTRVFLSSINCFRLSLSSYICWRLAGDLGSDLSVSNWTYTFRRPDNLIPFHSENVTQYPRKSSKSKVGIACIDPTCSLPGPDFFRIHRAPHGCFISTSGHGAYINASTGTSPRFSLCRVPTLG